MKKRISAVLLALAMLFTTAHAMPSYVDGSALGWQEPLTLEVESGDSIDNVKQKTAYEILTGDWSSDVCSSDLRTPAG